MSAGLSRRGLFRAIAKSGGAASDAHAEFAQIASISAACVEPKGVACRRCGEECDARAISFRRLSPGRSAACIDFDACTGCAACLNVCPVGAITLIPAERAALLAELVHMGASA